MQLVPALRPKAFHRVTPSQDVLSFAQPLSPGCMPSCPHPSAPLTAEHSLQGSPCLAPSVGAGGTDPWEMLFGSLFFFFLFLVPAVIHEAFAVSRKSISFQSHLRPRCRR